MSPIDRLPPRILMTAPLSVGQGPSTSASRTAIPTVGQGPSPDFDARTVTPEDLPALAELLVVSYAGTIDDLQQTPAEALQELDDFTSGRMLGPMAWDSSFLTPSEGPPQSVVLTAKEGERPLLGYIYTHPDAQGLGLATSLIALAREALATRGHSQVSLKVALENHNARRLYERLGFVPE